MNTRENLERHNEDEIDIAELLKIFFIFKWIILAVTGASAVIVILVAINLPNYYRAEALLVPAVDNEKDGLGSLASQYSGLASIAGINLSAFGGVDKTELAIETLYSRKFLADFLKRHNELPDLMAVKSWNRKSGTLVYDEDLYNSQLREWVRDVEPPLGKEPSLQEAHRKFLDRVSIEKKPENDFVVISFEHKSPQIAKEWIDWIIEDLNNTIKDQEVQEAQRAVEYLQERMRDTTLTELNHALAQLMEQQLRTVMLANIRPEYALRTVDPAVAPERPSRPNRPLICISVIIFTFFLTFIFMIMFHYLCLNLRKSSFGSE